MVFVCIADGDDVVPSRCLVASQSVDAARFRVDRGVLHRLFGSEYQTAQLRDASVSGDGVGDWVLCFHLENVSIASRESLADGRLGLHDGSRYRDIGLALGVNVVDGKWELDGSMGSG